MRISVLVIFIVVLAATEMAYAQRRGPTTADVDAKVKRYSEAVRDAKIPIQ